MQIFIVASLLAVAIANEVAYPAYPKPNYQQAAGYEKNYESYAPMPYNFDWSVYDQASYNDFSHQESSDGKIVTGSYRVLLPDSRVQIVTYKADDYGYVADVKYEGEAKYDSKPYSGNAYNQPKYQNEYASPAYNAKESYPSPAYNKESYPSPAYNKESYPSPAYNKESYPSPAYNKESYPSPSPYTPAKYPEASSTNYKPQPAYNKPSYPAKQYTEAQPAYNKPVYPAKQYTEAYPTDDYKPQSAYPAVYTPAKQYTESYPTDDYKPAYKAAPAPYAAQPAYNQPKYPAGDYVKEEYATTPKYESYPTTVYATKDY